MRRPTVPRLIASRARSISLLKFVHSSLTALLPKTKLPSSLATLVYKIKMEERKEEWLAYISKNELVEALWGRGSGGL